MIKDEGRVVAIVIRETTQCPICGKLILDNHEVVATPHFISDQNDPLWRFSNSAMHRSCFLGWNERSEFVAKFNKVVGAVTSCNGTYHLMKLDGMIVRLRRGSSYL